MEAVNEHPSYFQLELISAGETDPKMLVHLESCPRCRSYVDRLSRSEVLPAWLPAPRNPQRVRIPWSVRFGLAASLALAIGIVIPQLGRPKIRTKGSPAVEVYVKRGDEVKLWDGRERLRPGDRLRFRVSPSHFAFVTLAQREGNGWRALAAEPLVADSRRLLSDAFALNADPGDEDLSFVFTSGPLSSEDLQRAADSSPSRDCWPLRLVIPKQR